MHPSQTPLQTAIRARDIEAVRLLLNNDTSIDFGDALRVAAEVGDRDIVTLLLDKGARVDSAPGNGGTALRAAVKAGHQEIVQLLLEKGANPDRGPGNIGSPLKAAAEAGNLEILKLLVESSADLDRSPGNTGTPLRAAVQAGHQHVVQLLLDRGADIDAAPGPPGESLTETPLAAAARVGNKALVKLLLDRGADVNASSGSALDAAVRAGHKEVAALLRSRGASDTSGPKIHRWVEDQLSLEDSPTPWGRKSFDTHQSYHESSSDTYRHPKRIYDGESNHGREEIRDRFESELSPSLKASIAGGPLMRAVTAGNVERTRTTLQQGANPNGRRASLEYAPVPASGSASPPSFPNPPLVEAAGNGNIDIVKLLLEYHADIDLPHPIYGPPLIAAASNGHREMVQLLLSHGAKVSNVLQWLDDKQSSRAVVPPDYPMFQHLDSSPPTPPSLSLSVEILEDAVMMAAQLGIVKPKIDSIAWEWEVPSAIESQSWDLSLKNAVTVMQNPLRDPQWALSDHFLAMTWDEWLADCTPARERDAIANFLGLLMSVSAASKTKSGKSVYSALSLLWSLACQRADHVLGSRLSDLIMPSELHPRSLRHLLKDDRSSGLYVQRPVSITLDQHTVRVTFPRPVSFTDLSRCGIFPALEWLCLSLRPPRGLQHRLSSATYRLERYETGTLRGLEGSGTGLELTMALGTKPLQKTEHGCWQSLFDFCNIVQPSPFMLSWKALHSPNMKAKYIPPGTMNFGRGLEMSFDLMVSLAAVEYPLVINGGVVLIGCESALVPTAVSDGGDAAQFHLVTHAGGDDSGEGGTTMFNPYKADLPRRLRAPDVKQFRSMRCFLGWCASAQLNLGTQHLPARVKYSGARETSKSAALDGIETLFQLGINPAAPLSAVLGVQANYKYISHRRRFTPFSGYCTLLRDTAAKTVAVYDAAQRRGWLVPMLSLLLHMAHAYVLNSVDAPADKVPFVDGHADAAELISVLEPLGEGHIFGRTNGTPTPAAPDDHGLLFHQLLLGLRTNLLSTTEATKPSTHRALHGFEFMDVVSAPDRGACMRTVELPSASHAWFPLANAADAVVVCANIVEVITPATPAPASATPRSSSRNNSPCDTLPEDSGYLAATVPCLDRIARRRGCELPLAPVVNININPPNGAVTRPGGKWNHVKLSDDSFWELRGNPFAGCSHRHGHGPENGLGNELGNGLGNGHQGDGEANSTCWDREDLVQCVVKSRGSSSAASDKLARRMTKVLDRLFVGEGPPPVAVVEAVCLQRSIPPSGALVFG